MHTENYTGWDVGGAHLKVAQLDETGRLRASEQFATPLWQGLETLAQPLARARAALPDDSRVQALTMTGELADCFATRREGVIRLTEYFSARFGPACPLYLYAGSKGLVAPQQAPECHAHIASANWHASAAYAAQRLGAGLLVDLGTTTTDIIPFHENQVCARGYTDQERLRSGELVYTGVTRTPVMAVADQAPFNRVRQGLMAEYFANMADVYRVTGDLEERFDLMPAADGGAKTRFHSIKRLARMLGAEYAEGEAVAPWLEVARYFADKQFAGIERAWERVAGRFDPAVRSRIVAAGAGRFIIEKLARKNGCELVNFEELLPRGAAEPCAVNNCSTAVAVAALAREHVSAAG